jgi:hypothetical protein
MYEVMAHPQSGSSEASHLLIPGRAFSKNGRELPHAGVYFMDSQPFVPKAILQVPAVLEEVRRDGRADCLGRPVSSIEHEAGLP